MKTWNDYKEYVKSSGEESRLQMEELEETAAIIGAIIEQRKALGMSQRELASRCGITQSSVARIETLQTVPKLETVLKMMQPLGLRLTVSYEK